jgi:hypothetical protein
MSALIPLKSAIKANDLLADVSASLNRRGLNLANLSSATPDCAPEMLERRKRLISLLIWPPIYH